ncbi:hypothetical protein EYF80_012843 [Liparis tanakae]|uniref:Uncharacterized protein n=1 Tax=Liparis tanakae TaxID=230148 RepID=A0A4Z2IGR5_9TELE|nr:hypothetical protein EYF80_012843 [Liparis tanakae]
MSICVFELKVEVKQDIDLVAILVDVLWPEGLTRRSYFVCEVFEDGTAVLPRVDVPGFGGNIGGTNLAHLYEQTCDFIIERREGLAEGHQAGQDGHEEGETLCTSQH